MIEVVQCIESGTGNFIKLGIKEAVSDKFIRDGEIRR
jgi:hypothetical protein